MTKQPFPKFEAWLRAQRRKPKACSCGGPDAARERGKDYEVSQHSPDCAFLLSMDDLWNEWAEERAIWCAGPVGGQS